MSSPESTACSASTPHPAPGTAAFAVRHHPPAAMVVCVHGELDAANARPFSNFVQQHLAHTDQLILDLSAIEFFGTEAFSMLHTVSVAAAGKGARWVLLPSAAVSRVLRICDPDGALPTAAHLDDAVIRVNGQPPRLLQLVAKPR
ncbi:STAS domain-containing protein [Mycobacterium sp. NPDC003323]